MGELAATFGIGEVASAEALASAIQGGAIGEVGLSQLEVILAASIQGDVGLLTELYSKAPDEATRQTIRETIAALIRKNAKAFEKILPRIQSKGLGQIRFATKQETLAQVHAVLKPREYVASVEMPVGGRGEVNRNKGALVAKPYGNGVWSRADPLAEARDMYKKRHYRDMSQWLYDFLRNRADQHKYGDKAEAYILYGIALRHMGDWIGAIEQHTNAHSAADSNRFLSYKAEIELALDWRGYGDKEKALSLIDEVINKARGNLLARALRIRGMLYRELNSHGALEDLEKSLEIRPGDRLTLKELALTQWMMGDRDEALATLDSSIESQRISYSLLNSYGLRYDLMLKARMLFIMGAGKDAESVLMNAINEIQKFSNIDDAVRKKALSIFVANWLFLLEEVYNKEGVDKVLKWALECGLKEEGLRKGIEGCRKLDFLKGGKITDGDGDDDDADFHDRSPPPPRRRP